MNDINDHIAAVLTSLRDKTKKVFDEGPFGDDIKITRQEAAFVYRLMIEGSKR